MKGTKKINAYFTVEAALIFPFVMGVVLLTVYLLFFQYNRCLMEQAAGVLSLRGCALQTDDGKELAAQLLVCFREDDRAYLAWDMEDAKISLKGNRLRVACSGSLKFPFPGFSFWSPDNIWESGIVYESRRIKPADLIRDCRKITGGK